MYLLTVNPINNLKIITFLLSLCAILRGTNNLTIIIQNGTI